MKTPTIQLAPIGRNYPGLALPGVEQIQGVTIDNPSGSWLLVMPPGDYVAPYTLQWSRGYSQAMSSIDILYVQGPAGQRSTLEGNTPSVVLDSDPAGFSDGVPLAFVTRGEQPEIDTVTVDLAIGFIPPPPAADVTHLLGGSLTKRLRIYSIAMTGAIGGQRPDTYNRVHAISGVNASLIAILENTPNKFSDYVQLNPPRDLLPGAEVLVSLDIVDFQAGDTAFATMLIQYGIL